MPSRHPPSTPPLSAPPPSEPQLPAELLRFVHEWRERPGNLIMVLHRVQEHYGYIPRASAFTLAELLDVPVAKIYGVITFYHLFKLSAPGRQRIAVCMGTTCYLKGAEGTLLELQRLLGVGLNSVTADGGFSLETVRCIGCCGLAPVMAINGEVFGRVKKTGLAKTLAKITAPPR